jgi:phosphoglycolate phosphatase-like HAD superfamily hydrolase
MASDGVIKEMYKENLDAVIKSGTTPKVYPDAKEILELLKNKNKIVSVLSSHPEQNLLREIEEYELKIYLDLILGDRGENKVEGLKRTFMKFNKKSGDVLYTGDTVYDIQAAKKAETFSAGICNGYHLREALENESPDFLFENLTEIKKLEIL